VVHGGRRTSLQDIWFALEATTELFRGTQVGNTWTNATIVTSVSVRDQVAALRRQMRLGPEWVAIVLVTTERALA
jgi:hypothetical protein